MADEPDVANVDSERQYGESPMTSRSRCGGVIPGIAWFARVTASRAPYSSRNALVIGSETASTTAARGMN